MLIEAMREIFSFIFDMAIDPLGLPVEWYWEWLILAVIEIAAYKIAYRAVGNLYRESWIGSKTTGSILHWIYTLYCICDYMGGNLWCYMGCKVYYFTLGNCYKRIYRCSNCNRICFFAITF